MLILTAVVQQVPAALWGWGGGGGVVGGGGVSACPGLQSSVTEQISSVSSVFSKAGSHREYATHSSIP